MFDSFVIIGDNYLDSPLLDQFKISLDTNYIGFVD